LYRKMNHFCCCDALVWHPMPVSAHMELMILMFSCR
jgi:hypothetical protein